MSTFLLPTVRAFPEVFTEHLEFGRCPRPLQLPIPELIDLADGRPTYDESCWRERSGWNPTAESEPRPERRP